MRHVRSCGILIFRGRSFLLMHHAHRHDLPKGHTDDGESDRDCALRELAEETGILAQDIAIEEGFRYEERYQTSYKRFPGEVIDKTLVIFIARLVRDCELVLTEHIGYTWMPWAPPHAIQPLTIDPLLAQVADYFAAHPDREAQMLADIDVGDGK